MLNVHGANDVAIPFPGSIVYYDRVTRQMGGLAAVQSFYRLYIAPGPGHQLTHSGSANPAANPPVVYQADLYRAIIDWVEKGVEPAGLRIASPKDTANPMTLPLCAYPQFPAYVGGDPRLSASYACR